ncbi:MAG TPA: hypothetical protein PLL72_17730, partial [Burkholderiaceae bacterium]|nr:hypothetical protein [Burkholderiaceae bacterium]
MLLTWASSQGRPSLVLNFLQGIADSRITYSGGANGTRVNSSGVIVAATTPRFDYDPVTLAARGLLVEEARTNLCLRSEDFTNASWQTAGTATVTANTTVSPDGTQNADTVTANAADSIIYQQIAVSASTTYTGSFYMKAATNTTVTIYI